MFLIIFGIMFLAVLFVLLYAVMRILWNVSDRGPRKPSVPGITKGFDL